jgi:hypothetical protein
MGRPLYSSIAQINALPKKDIALIENSLPSIDIISGGAETLSVFAPENKIATAFTYRIDSAPPVGATTGKYEIYAESLYAYSTICRLIPLFNETLLIDFNSLAYAIDTHYPPDFNYLLDELKRVKFTDTDGLRFVYVNQTDVTKVPNVNLINDAIRIVVELEEVT